jgi:hypothetical protein
MDLRAGLVEAWDHVLAFFAPEEIVVAGAQVARCYPVVDRPHEAPGASPVEGVHVGLDVDGGDRGAGVGNVSKLLRFWGYEDRQHAVAVA